MTAQFTSCGAEPGQVVGGIGEAASDAVVVDPTGEDLPAIRLGFTALVVEDNMLIAMDAEEALHEMGASEVQLRHDVASALACIGANIGAGVRATAFDVALLDVNLGNETSEAIAIALRESGTPFVIITGFGDYVSGIAAYAGVPVLTKPYPPAALLRAVSQVMI